MNDSFRLHAELTHADLLRNFCPPMSRNSAAGGLRPQNAFKRTGVVSEGEGLGRLSPPPSQTVGHGRYFALILFKLHEIW